jgi:thioredoxin 1
MRLPFRRSVIDPAPTLTVGKDEVMAGNAIELTDATFDEVVHNSTVPVLVDFWATWCGPCKMMVPIIEDLAANYAGKAKICKLNTDEARDSAIEFGISAIPTLLLFKDGQVKQKWVGLTSKKELSSALDGLL